MYIKKNRIFSAALFYQFSKKIPAGLIKNGTQIYSLVAINFS